MKKQKSIMRMFVNREKLAVWFECDGDLGNWSTNKTLNSITGYRITQMARLKEVHDFAYEMYLDKFIKKYSKYVKEVVEI